MGSLPIQTSLAHRGPAGPLAPPPGSFAALGGRAAVARLVDGLYDRIEADTALRPALSRDLARERGRARRFFEAWLGGEPAYFDAAWPPGMAAAHAPVSISRGMAERWLGHFLASLAEVTDDQAALGDIRRPAWRLALSLVSRADEPAPGERLRDVADAHLMRAVQRDDAEALAAGPPQILLLHGPRLLLAAALRGRLAAAEALVRRGVEVNAVAVPAAVDARAHGLPMLPVTPICGALAAGRAQIVGLLAGGGAQYDIFTAALLGDLAAVREALDVAPALADSPDPGCDVAGVTPLLHAASAGRLEVARLLLARGATVGANSARLVRAAANRGDAPMTELLLAHGADPSAVGAGAWVMHPAIAGMLLARGADVNREPGAWVGLCCTGNSGHRENAALAQAMLRCGADVGARYKGRTALHCAAQAGFAQVAEALIAHGADVGARDDRGRTPLDDAERPGGVDREPVRRLLLAHGARRG